MSYTTFYLWCPYWEPTQETNHPDLHEAITEQRWGISTPWCLFSGPPLNRLNADPMTIRETYANSTPENVAFFQDNYRCTTHNTPPEVLRRYHALARRQSEARGQHYTTTIFRRNNAPEELRRQPYYMDFGRYIFYEPKLLGREHTLHLQWRND